MMIIIIIVIKTSEFLDTVLWQTRFIVLPPPTPQRDVAKHAPLPQ